MAVINDRHVNEAARSIGVDVTACIEVFRHAGTRVQDETERAEPIFY